LSIGNIKGKTLSRKSKELMSFDNIELEPILKDEITGVVLQPNITDGQNQVVDAQEVKEACQIWNEAFEHLTIQHRDKGGYLLNLEALTNPATFKDCFDSDFEILSSQIIPDGGVLNGKKVNPGSWLLSLKVLNPKIFTLIKEGILNGYSIGALGIRESNHIEQVSNLIVPEVSIVAKPAHKRNFLIIKGLDLEEIRKPYPNEHACRLQEPNFSEYTRGTRESNGRQYSIIFGRNEEGNLEEQAYRYNIDTWQASQARQHCQKHRGRFEPAKTKEK